MQLHRIKHILLILCVVFVAFLEAPSVLADAPGTRGETTQAQGGTATSHPSLAWSWEGVLPLPPLSPLALAYAPLTRPYAQESNSSGFSWLSRELNPGNWILDAGMGIFAGILATVSEVFQKSVQALLGTGSHSSSAWSTGASALDARSAVGISGGSWSIIPGSCADSAAYNFVFCTPANLTYAHSGIQTIWSALRPIANALVTLLFVIRIGRLMLEGQASLATEGKSLILTFLGVIVFIQSTEWVCRTLIEFFNGLSNLLLDSASAAFPAQTAQDSLGVGAAFMALLFWLLVLLLTFKSFWRLINIAVLIGVAPLAGALLMDRATSARFRGWLNKLVDLLTEQVSLIIVFTCSTALLSPVANASAGDQFVQFLMGTVTMVLALCTPQMVAIAGNALGNGYLQSMIQMRGLALAGKGGSTLGRALGGRAASAIASVAEQRGLGGVANAAGSLAARFGRDLPTGDPSASAGAQRAKAARMPHGSNEGIRATDTLVQRGQSHSHSSALTLGAGEHYVDRQRRIQREAASKLPDKQARAMARAAVTARSMRDAAQVAAQTGDRARATTLRQKAEQQALFARTGRVPFKPGRYSERNTDGTMVLTPEGQARRRVYRTAQLEAEGRAVTERARLHQEIAHDRQVIAQTPSQVSTTRERAAQRTLYYQVKGRPERGLQAQQIAERRVRRIEASFSNAQRRLTANEARLATLTPGAHQTLAPGVRREAAVLARQRLATQPATYPSNGQHRRGRAQSFQGQSQQLPRPARAALMSRGMPMRVSALSAGRSAHGRPSSSDATENAEQRKRMHARTLIIAKRMDASGDHQAARERNTSQSIRVRPSRWTAEERALRRQVFREAYATVTQADPAADEATRRREARRLAQERLQLLPKPSQSGLDKEGQ